MIPSKLPESEKRNSKIKNNRKIVYRQREQNEMFNICIIKIIKKGMGGWGIDI